MKIGSPLSWGPRIRSAIDGPTDWEFLGVALGLYCFLSLSLFLQWPPPMADEGQFGDIARSFAEHGRLASTLIEGMDTAVYWQPPLYVLVLAPLVKAAGLSLILMRGFSVLLGGIAVVLSYALGKTLGSRSGARVGTLLLVCSPFFTVYMKYGRMDALCVTLILAAFVSVSRIHAGRTARWYLLPGLFSALALLTHPLGLVAPVSIIGGMALTPSERAGIVRRLGWFALPIAAGLLLWGLYVSGSPGDFARQMAFQFARKDRGWEGMFVGFVGRYRFVPFSLVMGLFSMAAAWTLPSSTLARFPLRVVLVGSVVTITVIGTRFELPYHVYWLPLACILGGAVAGEGSRQLRRIFGAVAFAAVLNGLLYFAYVDYALQWREREHASYLGFCQETSAVLPPRATVLLMGYPALYWGLQELRPDIRCVEPVFLDSAACSRVLSRVDCVVYTRSFAPDEDAREMKQEIDNLRLQTRKIGRDLFLPVTVGTERRFAYSAWIFGVSGKVKAP